MTETQTAPEAEATHSARRRRLRRPRWRYDTAGLTVATLVFCLSLTPSLLPRVWWLQGLQSGIVAAIGYGIGVLIAALGRALTGWSPSPRTRTWARRALFWGGPLLVAVFLVLGAGWQRDIYHLMGASAPSRYRFLGVLALAAVVFVALVGLARLLRRATRWVARLLGRWIPRRVAVALGVVIVALLFYGLVDGILIRAVMDAMNSSFKALNGETTAGVEAPANSASSGGPGSLVSWDSLGRKGRDFVAGGPTVNDLRAFSGAPARQPIRVYAGLDSAPTPEDEAALVVAELQRTGGFDRRVLCVVTTTGTGWVDGNGVYPLEYMYGGDTAIAAMQYSYLPSWLSFLVDRNRAKKAGRELFNQVYAVWSTLPPDKRPKLVVFGESLGTFGGEAAFSGVYDLRNRTDGVLWTGPPNSNTLWTDFVGDREPGTREVLPVYEDGETVRFGGQPSDLDLPPAFWRPPKVVYLQHASDPIVWWSPHLLLHRPDWLNEPRGPDVLPNMRWYPFVTFWQVTADMTYSTGVPASHGHSYGTQPVGAWADILPPPGWTDAKTVQLERTMSQLLG
jgi:uncharacterized membrane protein